MGERRGVYRILVGKPERNRPLEDADVDWKIILRRIFRKWNGSNEWIDLAQDRDRWRALVNAVINFRVPQNVGIPELAVNWSVSQ